MLLGYVCLLLFGHKFQICSILSPAGNSLGYSWEALGCRRKKNMGKVGENGVLGIENGFILLNSSPFEEKGWNDDSAKWWGQIYAHPGQVLIQK